MPGYSRRQLKEDKFAETAQGAALWASGHRRTVIWAASLVIVIAVAVALFVTWRSRQIDQANLELTAAMRTFGAPLRPAGTPAGDTPSFTSISERARAAEKEFKAIADKHSSVTPGKIARYLDGVALRQAGDNSAAEQVLKTCTDFSDKDVAALAKMALASIYRSSNRESEAAGLYKDIAQHPTSTVSKAAAQLELADMYEKNDPQQATSIYQQVQKDDPQSAAAQVAAQKLAGKK